MSMRFLAKFKKTCSFNDWLILVYRLKPHLEKHGITMIFAAESEDRQYIYDIAEAETIEGIEAMVIVFDTKLNSFLNVLNCEFSP